jgi:hypothetical protein
MTKENESTIEQNRSDLPDDFLIHILIEQGKTLEMVQFLKELEIKADPEDFLNPNDDESVASEIITKCNNMRREFERAFHERKIKSKRAVRGVLVRGDTFSAMELSPPVKKELKKGLPKFQMSKDSEGLVPRTT